MTCPTLWDPVANQIHTMHFCMRTLDLEVKGCNDLISTTRLQHLWQFKCCTPAELATEYLEQKETIEVLFELTISVITGTEKKSKPLLE